jgi:NADPH2:quinone reductase
MLFNNTTIRLLGTDDFPRPTSQQAARDIVACLEEGRLEVGIGARFPLDEIAAAHEAVDRPSKPGRVLLLLD